jgi:hypothetical protein
MSAPTVLLGVPRTGEYGAAWIALIPSSPCRLGVESSTLRAERIEGPKCLPGEIRLRERAYASRDTRTDRQTIGRYGTAWRPALLHFQHSGESGLVA